MDNFDMHPFQGITLRSVLRDNSIMGQREMDSRRFHGFIIKLQGITEYCTEDKTLQLSAGEILFVEKGSSYFIRAMEPGFSYVVNFDGPEPLGRSVVKLPLPKGFDIAPLAEKMYHQWQRENVYAALATLYSLLEKTAVAVQQKNYISPREKQLLEPVVDYLKTHLTDTELRLEDLPRMTGVSDAYLRRIFKKQYGVAPAGFVIRERIRMAKQLLVSGEKYQVAQVAAKVGYHDPLYFSRLFKKQTGLSPTEYSRTFIDNLF